MPTVEELQTQIEELQKKTQADADRLRTEKARLERELRERDERIARGELDLYAADALKGEGLPIEMRDIVRGGSKEEIAERVQTLKAHIQAAVDAAVNNRLGGGSVPKGGWGSDGSYDPKNFKNLTIEQAAAALNNLTREQ